MIDLAFVNNSQFNHSPARCVKMLYCEALYGAFLFEEKLGIDYSENVQYCRKTSVYIKELYSRIVDNYYSIAFVLFMA